MPDWSKSMQQSYEYYIVDPGTWKDTTRVTTVKSSTISRDADSETLGSATIDIVGSISECYIRIYMITVQNGIREKHALGTFLVQTPSISFDGKKQDNSLDAYTPLIELKEKPTPIGYALLKDENIMQSAYLLTRENARAPVAMPTCSDVLYNDFVAETDETWIKFIIALIANAKYEFALDEMGRILFSPKQDTASLQPVWTYDDSNSSILYPDISIQHDMYGIPNVLEVVYPEGFYDEEEGVTLYSWTVTNDDPNSPISTVNRGRKIPRRITNASGISTKKQMIEYATRKLKELSTLEYTVAYTHGYCPVRLGDCVRLNYSKAGLHDIKAKVISQNIKCASGCSVSEKAVFTTRLWG